MSNLPLSAIAEVNPTVRIPKGLSGMDAVSFIPMGDVSESGHWTFKQVRPFRSVAAGFTAFNEGDILIAKITPCLENGKGAHVVGLENGLGFGSTEFHVLRARPGNAQRFVFHLIQWRKFRHAAEGQMVGSAGQQRVPRSFFDEFLVANFDRDEQSTLAQILDTLDTTIRETEAIIAKLKAVKQGLLHDLLTRGLDDNGELRPPQSEAPHLYKQSALGWIPEVWNVLCLEEVSTLVTSGSRDWARFYSESGALFVRIGNLTRDHINLRFDSIIHVNPPRNSDGQRTRLEEGDILISITADLGIIGVILNGLGEAYINQHVALVRPNTERTNPRFMGHYLAGTVSQTNINNLNDAGAKAGLNLPTVRKLQLACPRRREQDAIANRLDEVDRQIQHSTEELFKLNKLKSGLMDDLLTGRVRVTPLLNDLSNSSPEVAP
jgi:type I restriction enzyme S subunit